MEREKSLQRGRKVTKLIIERNVSMFGELTQTQTSI